MRLSLPKSFLAILISCLAGIFLFLVIGEIYARHVYKKSYLTGFMLEDPVFHHIPPPNFTGIMHSEGDFDVKFTTNNRGMRGPGNYNYEKSKGTYRIAVLGDSFTFGVGVGADETMPALLQGLLNRSGGKHYEVYNFGVNSYSPILEYIYLKKEVIKYKPDLVILMLDICDIQDEFLYEPHIVYDPNGDIIGCDPLKINGHPDLRAIAMKYSCLFYVLDQKLFESMRKIAAIGLVNYISNKFNKIRNKSQILTDKDSDNIYFDRFLLFREGKDKEVVRRHWERTAKYLAMIKRYLDERGIKFLLVTYPYGYQVGMNQWAKGRRYWGFEADRMPDVKEGFAIISDFALNTKIDFINLYSPFSARASEKLYFNNDGHWTKTGQELAATAIYNSDAFKRNLR